MKNKGNQTIYSILHNIFTLFLIVAFWIGLIGEFSIEQVVFGFIIAIIALAFTNYIILEKGSYSEKFYIPVFSVLKYIFYLIFQIYAAGFSAMKKVLTGHIRVCIVDIETSLKKDFLISLLANSITLTPGTVTLDRNGSRLKIIWLSDYDEDLDTRGKIIKGSFESILSSGDEE